MLIGVTGGMGSGKSTLARWMAARGAVVIDADAVTHEVLREAPVVEALVKAFGADVLDARGEPDRREIGRRAFADPESHQLLEEAVRPALERRLDEQVAAALSAGPEAVVVDAPLIFEWGLQDRFDVVVLVRSGERRRIERIHRRGGLSEAEIRRRLAFQMDDTRKERLADHVVDNDGELAELERRAAALWEKLGLPAGGGAERS